MAKTKKMAFGGLGGRPVAGNAPQQFMSNALRSGAMKPTQGMMGGNGPAPANALRPMPARMPAPQGMMGGNGPAPADALRPMPAMGMKKGGSVKSASARADGIAIRGKTRA